MQSLKRTGRFGNARGFSMVEVTAVMMIVGVISAAAVLGLRSARAAMRLNNSARVFAQNIERARLDAIRRHDSTNVEFTAANTYEITMDYTGSGVKTTRSFKLDTDVALVDTNGNTITDDSYPYADFDWRGRTSECAMFFQMKNSQGNMLKVQVAGSGDITVKDAVTNVPTVTYSNVNQTADIAPNAIATGSDTRMNLAPCGTTSGSGGGSGGGGSSSGPATGTCSAGTLSVSPQYLSIRRNGGSTGTVTATVTSSGSLSTTVDPNLSATAASSQTIGSPSGGTLNYTIRSINRTRGTFPIKFNFSNCSPATVYVKVTN